MLLLHSWTGCFQEALESLHCVSSGSLCSEAVDNKWSLADTPGMGTICPSPIRPKDTSGTLDIIKEIVYFPSSQSHAISSLQKCLLINSVIIQQY